MRTLRPSDEVMTQVTKIVEKPPWIIDAPGLVQLDNLIHQAHVLVAAALGLANELWVAPLLLAEKIDVQHGRFAVCLCR